MTVDNVVSIASALISLIASVCAAVALFQTKKYNKESLERQRKEATIHAYQTLQKQVLDKLVIIYSTNPGNATQDQVFLLSVNEVNQYYNSPSERECKLTKYAVAKGEHFDCDISYCWWWLRSPGIAPDAAAAVYNNGRDDYAGGFIDYAGGGIRPALWIDLNS